jgi:hypothetical protein
MTTGEFLPDDYMEPELAAQLDGKPEEFPTRDAAMREYRLLWLSWLAQWGSRRQSRWRKQALEIRMGELQTEVCVGPGPLWLEFSRTLPGFVEFWGGLE